MSPDTAGPGRTIPAGRVARGTLRLPPSKSLTNRWLNLALLSGEATTLVRPLEADDTRRFRRALEDLGFEVESSTGPVCWRLRPPRSLASPMRLDCGASGSMLRFLTASLTAIEGSFELDGTPRLRQRPIGPLIDALRRLGAGVECLGEEGFAPVRVAGASLEGGDVEVDAGRSSQFVSALLMAASRARRPTILKVRNLVSRPYVEVTCDLLAEAGARIERRPARRGSSAAEVAFDIAPGAPAGGRREVEGDASSAAYPAAAAALTGGDVTLLGLGRRSAQGDLAVLGLLERMGARVEFDGGWRIRGEGPLLALEVDLGDLPDQVPTLAALAPFARGTTVLRGAAHLRWKESDRLAALVDVLGRAGARVRRRDDGLEIEGTWSDQPPPAEPVAIDPHDDHRIAMAAALLGLRRPGLRILDPGVVQKSYPDFWQDLDRLLG